MIKLPSRLGEFLCSSMISSWLGLVALILLPAGTTVLGDEIHVAAQDGDLPKIKVLLQANPSMHSRPGPFGATPLHFAAAFGYQEIVELLLAKHASSNARTVAGKTPLHWAASEGRTNVVRFLLGHGSMVNVQDEHGNTPLHDAALNGRNEVVKLLLNSSADVNAKDNDGKTPLYKAVLSGDEEMAALLRQHGGHE